MKYLAFSLFAAASAALAGPVQASTVVIWPVDPIIKPGEQATALWLENKGDTPVTLQVRSFDWSQSNGEDQLANQDEVVASPPIATVAPGKRQLVRIIRRAMPAAGSAAERSYRLIIDELPVAPPAGQEGTTSAGLAVQMRYSIPLFTYAADPVAQAPRLVSTMRASARERMVEIRNSGTGHARLTDLRMVLGGREQVLKPGLAGYVLPGATMRFAVPDNAAGTLKASVNGKDVTMAPAI